jgi:hypothetical protein
MANLPAANDAHNAEPFNAAVAPVKMRGGGYSGDLSTASRRSGITAWEK